MGNNRSLDSKALFNEAINLINGGDLSAASEVCRKAIAANPDDVSLTALLGAVLLKTRQPEEAEKYLQRSIELAPTFAKPHEDLGFLLLESGRSEEAVEILEKAVRLDSKSVKGYFSLGRAYANIGKGSESDAAFEKSFALDPERKKLALAAEHHKAGRHKEAEKLYRELLRENPNNVDAMRMLAGIAASRSFAEEAESLFRRAISLAPDFALAHLDLGMLLQEQHRYSEAIECFAKTAALQPKSPKPHFLLGSILSLSGKTTSALKAYKHTLKLQQKHPSALLGLGHTLKTLGQQQEAIDAYRDCIRLKPDNGEVYWSLANLKTYKLSSNDIEIMEATISNNDDLSDQSRVNFLFALAKAKEDEGKFGEAWDYYGKGNKIQRGLEHYDPVQTEVTNDSLIQVFSKEFIQNNKEVGNQDSSPIFVVGLPRSGSTLVEQILASHSMVEGTAELPYLGRVATSLNRNRADGVNYPQAIRELETIHLQVLGQNYLDHAKFHRETDRPIFIDKNPNNFPSIGLINSILPNAKIIDVRRYPIDSTLSCYRQLFAKGQTFVYDLTDIGEYYLQYQRMMDHWDDVLPGRVHMVQYEEMVMGFEQQVRDLLEYCELPWEDSCLNFYKTDRPVRTASSEQVRQPVYRKSVHFWRNYEDKLGELTEILEPILPRYEQYEYINRDV